MSVTTQSFLDGRVVLHPGDCREVLKTLADNSVDSVCTDPPYHLTSIVKRFGGENAKPVKSNLEHSVNKDLGTIQAAAFKRLSKGFMGRTWDGGDIAFQPELWAEVLRVLKPGGYIVAFGGARTYHRMACAIEDAGFITHPMFLWIFGSGFPKAHSVSKQIDKTAGATRDVIGKAKDFARDGCKRDTNKHKNERDVTICDASGRGWDSDITAPATDAAHQWDGWFYGTQSLKPALEPIYMGQKPFSEKTGAANVLRWGTGALNIGVCKIPCEPIHTTRNYVKGGLEPGGMDKAGERTFTEYNSSSRWPANLAHDGSEEVLACFPETGSGGRDKRGVNIERGQDDKGLLENRDNRTEATRHEQNSGSAARFFARFPQDDNGRDGEATANKRYTDEGATNFTATPGRRLPPESAHRLFYTAKADANDRLGSKHPTVKPLDLIQWLVRLITPPGGTTLDLFAGTGTTGETAVREGFKAILIEREMEYQADIARRMSLVMDGKETRKHAGIKARGKTEGAGPLFDNEAAE